jgi:hypothetical protein
LSRVTFTGVFTASGADPGLAVSVTGGPDRVRWNVVLFPALLTWPRIACDPVAANET